MSGGILDAWNRPVRERCRSKSRALTMLDVLMLAIAIAFFAAYVGYVHLCDRL